MDEQEVQEQQEQARRNEAKAFADDLRRMADLIDKLERPINQRSAMARAHERSDRERLRCMARAALRELANFWI